MPVVSVCPVHGSFSSVACSIEDATGVTLAGNSERCPQCGRAAAVMEGSYDFDPSGLATVLSAPGWSKRALRAIQDNLGELAEELAETSSGDDRVDEILTRLDRQDEQLARVVRGAVQGRPRNLAHKAVVGIFSTIGVIVTLDDGVRVGTEVVNEIVKRFF